MFLFRQKLRKYIKNEFDEDVAKFRENPDEDDDVEEIAVQDEKEDDDDGSDLEIPDKSEFLKESFKKGTI
jgi:translation initiation factor 3 subunit C